VHSSVHNLKQKPSKGTMCEAKQVMKQSGLGRDLPKITSRSFRPRLSSLEAISLSLLDDYADK